jgi:hypothetical protein
MRATIAYAVVMLILDLGSLVVGSGWILDPIILWGIGDPM